MNFISKRCATSALMSVWFVLLSNLAVYCAPHDEKQMAAQIDMSRTFADSSRQLGFRDSKTVLFADVKEILDNTGNIVSWNLFSRKKTSEMPLTKWVDNFDLVLSENGKILSATNSRVDISFPHVKAYRATILSSNSLKTIGQYSFPLDKSATGLLFDPSDEDHLIIKGSSLIKVGDRMAYGMSHLDWMNLRTKKIDKSIPYYQTGDVDRVLSSPSRKYFLTQFYSEPFNSYGESDYGLSEDQLEKHGYVDVLDPKTGKKLWHLEGTDKQPVGDPLFFISPTRFVSSDTVFNITTKTARHWNAITPTRKCLAAVPNHPNCALFLTPSGLQLRDWQKDKALVSWPNIKKPGRILFSPDLKMFSFKRGSLIQFWKFDPKWLR